MLSLRTHRGLPSRGLTLLWIFFNSFEGDVKSVLFFRRTDDQWPDGLFIRFVSTVRIGSFRPRRCVFTLWKNFWTIKFFIRDFISSIEKILGNTIKYQIQKKKNTLNVEPSTHTGVLDNVHLPEISRVHGTTRCPNDGPPQDSRRKSGPSATSRTSPVVYFVEPPPPPVGSFSSTRRR